VNDEAGLTDVERENKNIGEAWKKKNGTKQSVGERSS
jgi:hypothetical protein